MNAIYSLTVPHSPTFFSPYGVPGVTLDCDRPAMLLVSPVATALIRFTVVNISGY
jgi:hypothetical protein